MTHDGEKLPENKRKDEKEGLEKKVVPFRFTLGNVRSVDNIVNEPSGLLLIFTGERGKDDRVKKIEMTAEEKQARIHALLNEEFRQSYELFISKYIGKFEASKTQGGQPEPRMDFRLLWNPTYKTNSCWDAVSDKYKLRVEYKIDARVAMIFSRKVTRTEVLTPEKLEEIAGYRKANRLYYVTFSQCEKGKLCALMNLSMVALQSKDLSVEEGKDLVKNLYFAIYITSEKLEPDIYDIFCRIERVPHGGFLQTDDKFGREIAKYSHELRKMYGLDVNRGYGTMPKRRSKEVEELMKRTGTTEEH